MIVKKPGRGIGAWRHPLFKMQKEDKHVAIVGAGLVGSLLSIYLVKRGYQVSVFERRRNMRTHVLDGGRSINMALSNRGIRALDHVGLCGGAAGGFA